MSVPRRRQGGFTLLEILVALVVLSMLVLGLAQTTRFGLDAWHRQSSLAARSAGLGPVEGALRRLIAAMDPGGPEQPPEVAGGPHRLAFRTRLPIAAGARSTRRARVVLRLDHRHRLWLLWQPAPPVIPFRPPPWRKELLLARVRALDLAYWGSDPRTGASAWQPGWRLPRLPGLIRIRIVLAGARHRPPITIVAAPRLAPRE